MVPPGPDHVVCAVTGAGRSKRIHGINPGLQHRGISPGSGCLAIMAIVLPDLKKQPIQRPLPERNADPDTGSTPRTQTAEEE